MKARSEFSHLLQGASFMQNRQRAEAQGLSQRMTSAYHRAARVSEDGDNAEPSKESQPPKREQSEADRTIDQMRRAYNKGLGLPEDDGVEHDEGSGETHQDKV